MNLLTLSMLCYEILIAGKYKKVQLRSENELLWIWADGALLCTGDWNEAMRSKSMDHVSAYFVLPMIEAAQSSAGNEELVPLAGKDRWAEARQDPPPPEPRLAVFTTFSRYG